MTDKVDNYATKDQELAEKLQNDEACTIIKVKTDPTDGLKEFTFEKSESEINKILGVKSEKVVPEKVAEEKAEVLPEVKKKKAGRPKKKGR